MLKSEKQTANSKQLTAGSRSCSEKVSSGQWAVGSQRVAAPSRLRRVMVVLLLTAHCTLLTASCRRDMQDQPKMKPFRSSSFFKDGLSSRPPVAGTVPRGFLQTDTEYFTGKKAGRGANAAGNQQSQTAGSQVEPTGAPQATGQQSSAPGAAPALQGAAAYPDDIEILPIAVTQEIVQRGKERYEIFCSACHGLTGKGDGMIVRRGFRRAASFHDPRLREAPVGHFFDAVTNGWGAMPSYAPQIPVQDRWAIIAYIRALQLSQESQTSAESAPAGAASRTPAPNGGQHR